VTFFLPVAPIKRTLATCRYDGKTISGFVLRELLGYEQVRNYHGSWTEWGNLVDVPIEQGA